MSMEFHGRTFTCAEGSLIPSGPTYRDTSYQSCAYEGVAPGSVGLDGDTYLRDQFGFAYGNVGRNFGIIFLFIFACVLMNILLVEKIQWTTGGGAMEFAHENRATKRTAAPDVESDGDSSDEKGIQFESPSNAVLEPVPKKDFALSQPPFVWRHINYTVPHEGKEKLLLDDVSGYCAPGSLTALVGVSGAGKSTRKFPRSFVVAPLLTSSSSQRPYSTSFWFCFWRNKSRR